MTEEIDRHMYTDAEARNMLGFSSAAWTRLKREGLAPKPKKSRGHRDTYPIEAIDAWRLGNRQAS